MKILKKIAESMLATTAGVAAGAIADCALGHKQNDGKCSFRNVQLPCAREWLKLAKDMRTPS